MADPTTPPYTQKLYFQSHDTTGFYRRRLILPFTPVPVPTSGSTPPSYDTPVTPLYTVKNHAHGSLSRPNLSSRPDITLYLGGTDTCPVIATGVIGSKRSIGELKFFPRTGAEEAVETTVKWAPDQPSAAGPKGNGNGNGNGGGGWGFSVGDREMVWVDVSTTPAAGAGEQLPPVQTSPRPRSVFGKLKNLVFSQPPPTSSTTPGPGGGPRVLKSLQLQSINSARVVATFTELPVQEQPTWRNAPPVYVDGHYGVMEVFEEEQEVGGGGGGRDRDVAVATLVLMLEAERRGVANGRLSASFGFGMGGCGGSAGCGGS